jgi:hypothetical protein
MKILVATKEKQGNRSNDFSWAKEGEMVKFGFECDGETIDGNCGCRRSLVGFDTAKATTTFKVVNKNLTKEKYKRLLLKSEKKAGFLHTKEAINGAVDELLRIANNFTIGDVLEKRGNQILLRR